jgi:hypothetical protein
MAKRTSKDMVIRISHSQHPNLSMKKNSPKPDRQPNAVTPPPTALPAESCKPPTLRNLFAIDPRSLALFRIAIGLLLLADLLVRATDLTAMYTDDGMFPRAVIHHHFTSIWIWSFHFGSGTWAFQAVLFGIAAVLALALLVGFKTRWVVIGSWLMLMSVQNRVPPILYGGDHILRMLLFWAMFLPLERVWSVDTWLKNRRGNAVEESDWSPVLSVASAAILLQMALMYMCSAIYKSNPDWFQGGVITGTLAHDFYAKPLAAWALHFPQLLTGLTWGTFLLEWAGPLLLFVPWRTVWVRLAVVTALAAMHLGIELLLTVGLFSFVALAGLTLFLPAVFWNSRLFARFPLPTGQHKVPTSSGNEPSALHWASQGLCGLLLIYVLAVNLAGLFGRSQPNRRIPGSRFLNEAGGLAQKWNMFEDTPSKDGWYVARALLNDRSEVDLLRQGTPVNWERPVCPAVLYPNHRWRQLFREMSYEDALGYQVFRQPVAEFICRRWNTQHPPPRQVSKFEFIYSIETSSINENGSKVDVTVRERLLRINVSGK